MKKIAAVLALLLLTVLLAVGAAAAVVDSGRCGDNLTWTLYDDGLLEISGNGEMTDYEVESVYDEDIYWYVDVTSAPWGNRTKTVVINPGVESVGIAAFYGCTNIESITISSSISRICSSAFAGCSNLEYISIPNGVSEIGHGAFSWCRSIKSIVIPNGVTSISYVFSGCANLSSVIIPSSVTDISYAFSGCSSLEYITIPDSVTNIDAAFSRCTALQSIVIPGSVTTIGRYAFSECRSLQNIDIPDSVTSIGESAFLECSSLEQITIPKGVTSIGVTAFAGCSSLTRVSIPDSVTLINRSAFANCSSLESIVIPNSVTQIYHSAFYNCRNLTNITLPDNITNLPMYIFSGCTSLKNITIPNSINTINGGAFYKCTGLESITIPSNVTRIRHTDDDDWIGAFEDCTNLRSIYFSGNAPKVSEGCFLGVTATAFYPDNNETYTESIKNNYGGSLTWTPYTVHVNQLLTITAQPTDKTAAVGTQVTMSVGASGTGTLTYQWQYKNKTATTWNNASGKAADWVLTAYAVHYGFDFRCVVRDTYGNTATSNVVHINPTLTITTQPTDKAAAVGSQVTMSVGASGTGTLSYQWQYKQKTANTWSNASGKAADWVLTVYAVHYGFDFRCVVRDTYGNTATSNVVRINPTLTFTAQPTDKAAAVGSQVTMSVGASGTGTLSYQWQYKQKTANTWTNASGKAADWVLTVYSVHYGFDFRCVVTDTYGNTAISNVVRINPALTITAQPTDKTAAVGTQVTMSVGASGTGTLSYQWQYRSRSAGSWTNASGKTADWVLTAYAVHYGFDFRCVVRDAYGNTATSNVVHINPAPALTITAQPTDKTASVGSQVAMSVTASGTGTLSYQWQYRSRSAGSWTNASGKTADWVLTVYAVHYGFDFRCVVTDNNGNTAISNTVQISRP